MESTCKELAVVAIDFGTTFSGYAYSFKSEYQADPKKISCNTKWTTGTNEYGSLKTPTSILLRWDDDEGDFESVNFGYDAQNRYTELVDEGEHDDYVLVDRFKMDLYSESAASGLRRDTDILLRNGKRIKAITLISMFIGYLKDHFFELIDKRNIKITVTDIRWVLTVPAIWTDGAKQFMREAAEMAGIPSAKLTVAYEPEAAALCCVHLSDPTNLDLQPLLKKGAKCLVLDAGGGTVDFTVHEVSDSKSLVIKHEASGGPWGGTVVDNKFLEMFVQIVGQDVFDSFAEKHREDLVELYRDFEYKKRSLRDDQKKLTVRFPVSMGDTYKDMKRKSIESAVSGKYGDKIQIVRDKMRIDTSLVKELLEIPCRNIVDHTRNLLRKKQCHGINTILLVGGFGNSEVIQKNIRKNFPGLNVITPEDPELAVVKGAVLYGHNPSIVKSRIARYTYGVDKSVNFVEGKHPANLKVVSEGLNFVENVFDIFANRGQVLEIGKSDRKTRKPVSSQQKKMRFRVYASTEEEPKYVTDDSCIYIGELNIHIPDTTGGLERLVTLEISFGETEITLTATEKKTDKAVSVNLNFLG